MAEHRDTDVAARSTPPGSLDDLGHYMEATGRLSRENDRLRNALGVIADSYPWEPYERDETIRNTKTPTNRRLAREALGA